MRETDYTKNPKNIHLSTYPESHARFPLLFLQARDLLRDTYQSLGSFKKPGQEGSNQSPCRLATRAMEACRKAQILHIKEGQVKGVRLRIIEDGVGREFSQLLPNLSLGTNLTNQLTMGKGEQTQRNGRQLTLGRLLIVGQKAVTIQKTIISQQAAYHATKKHDAQRMAKADQTNSKDNNERQTFTEQKNWAF